MPNQADDQFKLRRRDFLRLLSNGAFVLAGAEVLAGCGGGGGGNAAPRVMAGTVNLNQIGGSGLTVQTAGQTDAQVNAVGAFTTNISTQGTQLHTVADSSGNLRGLSLSNPSTTQPHMSVDAMSTALSLVFITPGILTTTPSEASQRIAQIQLLKSFDALVTYLAANLAQTLLSDIRKTSQLDNLIAACIDEWSNTNGRSPRGVRSRDAVNANFSAQWGAGTPASQQIVLGNGGWRRVNVVRQYLDASGTELPSPVPALLVVPDPMDGALAVSWGSIVDLSAGDPKVQTVTVNLQEAPNIATVVIWVRGSGLKSGVQVPDSVKSISYDNARFETLIYYLFFPFVDLLIGKFSLAEESIGADLYDFIYQRAQNIPDLEAAIEAGDVAKAATLVTDIFTSLLAAVVGVLASSLALGEIGTILTVASAAMGLANVIKALNTWLHYPNAFSIQLPVSSAGVTIQ